MKTKRSISGLAIVALVIGWTAGSVSANTGPGAAIKIGAQTLESPVDGRDTTRLRVEAELSSALMANGHADFFVSVGGSPLGDFEYVDTYDSDGIFYEDDYSHTFSLIDVRLGARLYPLGHNSTIRPHVGGGIGYYWLRDHYDDDYYTWVPDPYSPGSYLEYYDYAEDTETISDAFFPFITAGVSAPISDNVELLFDLEYDFGKDESGVDLGGAIYMLGARIRL